MSVNIRRGRLEYLDAMRGAAAIAVFIQHLLGYIYKTNDTSQPLYTLIDIFIFETIDLGRFGVVLFFLISGFIIPQSLNIKSSLTQFFIGRVFRLYPAYWLTCILIFIVSPYLTGGGHVYEWSQLVANLTMVPKILHQQEMSGVFWTLFIEVLFYFSCVMLFILNWLEKPIYIACIAILFNLSTPLAILSNKFLLTDFPIQFVLFHLSFLFFGSLLRLAITKKIEIAKNLSYVVLCLLCFTIPITTGTLFSVQAAIDKQFVIHSPIAVVVAYFSALSMFIVVISFKSKFSQVLIKLGHISYSLYLLHMLCLSIVATFIVTKSFYDSIVFIVLSTIFSILIAQLSYRYIEMPGVVWGKQIAKYTKGQ